MKFLTACVLLVTATAVLIGLPLLRPPEVEVIWGRHSSLSPSLVGGEVYNLTGTNFHLRAVLTADIPDTSRFNPQRRYKTEAEAIFMARGIGDSNSPVGYLPAHGVASFLVSIPGVTDLPRLHLTDATGHAVRFRQRFR